MRSTPETEALLADLDSLLDVVASRLGDTDAWMGMRISEPDGSFEYGRLVCRDRLSAPGRKYMVGVHRFSGGGVGALHNHMHPIAVYPFAGDARPGDVLYEMPWQRRDGDVVVEEGVRAVRAGEAYAIAPCLPWFHAVRSARPHASIVLSDVQQPAARPNRLSWQEVDAEATAEMCRKLSTEWRAFRA